MTKQVRILTVLVALMLGCQAEPQITTQILDRREPRRPVFDAESRKQEMDHTLVAIIPVKKTAWFFKTSGQADQIELFRDAFLSFLQAVEPPTEAGRPPAWNLPEGWQEDGPSPMRAATIKVPREAGGVEIAVSSLPLSSDWDGFLSRNVSRWMDQLSQGPLSQETIGKLVQEIDTQAGKATLLHLAGRLRQRSIRDPHAEVANSAVTSPQGSESIEQRKATSTFDYDTPEGWRQGQLSSMRKAAFDIVDGELSAEVTVIAFPVSGGAQITDVTANVRRWAGQVGLGAIDEESLGKLIEPKSIDGVEGSFVTLLSSQDAEKPVGMLGAMVVNADSVWFFKMLGDRSLIERQQDNFRSFLDSVRFD